MGKKWSVGPVEQGFFFLGLIALCTGLYLEGLIFTAINQMMPSNVHVWKYRYCVEENESENSYSLTRLDM